MNKATVNMTNWQLYVYNDDYSLSGTADRHPSLGKSTYISRTSPLVSYQFDDDVLTYETQNTIYVCPLKYMRTYPYRGIVADYIKELTHRGDKSECILDKIIAATAKLSISETQNDVFLNHIIELQKRGQIEIESMMRQEEQRLIELARNYEDCVYIEVSNVGSGSLLAYHLGDYTGVVQPELHSGMFQDSVLYMKYESEDDPCSLDFRYFPQGLQDIMETYSWSDNIKRAVIKNDTGYSLKFNRIDISMGETVIFTPDGHRQGLISPDCHNGKSCLTIPKERVKENEDS